MNVCQVLVVATAPTVLVEATPPLVLVDQTEATVLVETSTPTTIVAETPPTVLVQAKAGPQGPPGGDLSILTKRGDLATHNGSAVVALDVGTNGYVLKANSFRPEGIEWSRHTLLNAYQALNGLINLSDAGGPLRLYDAPHQSIGVMFQLFTGGFAPRPYVSFSQQEFKCECEILLGKGILFDWSLERNEPDRADVGAGDDIRFLDGGIEFVDANASIKSSVSGQIQVDADAITINADLDHDGTNIGVFGTAPVAKQTVTGSRGGNAALASLLTALENYGLITDNTTA